MCTAPVKEKIDDLYAAKYWQGFFYRLLIDDPDVYSFLQSHCPAFFVNEGDIKFIRAEAINAANNRVHIEWFEEFLRSMMNGDSPKEASWSASLEWDM